MTTLGRINDRAFIAAMKRYAEKREDGALIHLCYEAEVRGCPQALASLRAVAIEQKVSV